MINYIDNFLSQEDYGKVIEYCLRSPFYYGEVDSPNFPPTGMVSEVSKEKYLYKLFDETIKQKIDCVKNLKIYRMYINCFAPGENPYYHIDGEGITCLYYVNPEFSINDGGETQFLFNNESINILPISNRLCFFNADILHKATSFRNKHRFTIAIKYN